MENYAKRGWIKASQHIIMIPSNNVSFWVKQINEDSITFPSCFTVFVNLFTPLLPASFFQYVLHLIGPHALAHKTKTQVAEQKYYYVSWPWIFLSN